MLAAEDMAAVEHLDGRCPQANRALDRLLDPIETLDCVQEAKQGDNITGQPRPADSRAEDIIRNLFAVAASNCSLLSLPGVGGGRWFRQTPPEGLGCRFLWPAALP